ncbi:MAG: DNA repair protein RecN, partial [Myxococcota bacterium]
MLTYVIIRDFAIIDHLEIAWGSGFSTLTGETGAGKSILINALNLILGGRASTDVIRAGAERAVVEATFELSPQRRAQIDPILTPQGIDCGDELIIRRMVIRNGRNKAFVNGSVVSVSTLHEVTRGLVDISGQHEHYSLIDPEQHVTVLDNFGGLQDLAGRVASDIDRLGRLRSEVRRLVNSERERLARLDFLKFQLNAIDTHLLSPLQERELNEEVHMLRHAEMLREQTAEINQRLHDGQFAASDALGEASSTLTRLLRYDERLSPIVEILESARIQLDEAARELRGYTDKLNVDPERLEMLEETLYEHQQLKRKYGDDHDEIMERVEAMRAELKGLLQANNRIEQAKAEVKALQQQVMAEARTLSSARSKTAKQLKESVEAELSQLGMVHCRFAVQIEHRDGDGRSATDLTLLGAESLNARGLDVVEFMLRPNPGAGWGPLARIASGGELSRIMLAIKTGLMATDPIETYVFDEVDTGIGGATADIVGEKIKTVARNKQVICITHLPQIASYGNH